MANVRSGTIHDQWIQTVKSLHTKEISRLDLRRIDIDKVGCAGWHVVAHALQQEGSVSISHVVWNLEALACIDVDEHLQETQEGFGLFENAIA